MFFSFIVSLFFLVQSVAADTITVDNTIIEVDGVITSTLRDDNTLYIGGSFEQVQVANKPQVERINLVEIDLEKMSVSSWDPRPNSPIQDLALYNNTLFIAGQFTTFDAEDRSYIVQVQSQTKEFMNILIRSDDPIYGLYLDENILYVTGSFTQINEQTRMYAAAFDLEQQELVNWAPDINDTVYDVVTTEDRVYIGGAFTQVNNQLRPQIAAFDKSTGNLINWNPITDLIITNLRVDESGIEATGFIRTDDKVEARQIIYDEKTGAEIQTDEIPISSATYSAIWQQEENETTESALMVDQDELGFQIPTLSDILTFAIRAFFVIAGLAALFFLLLGAFAWVTSGGDQDSITAAREKIQAAVVGLLMMVAVLAIVWTLEQVIFNRRICLGLSCPVTIPALLEPVEE